MISINAIRSAVKSLKSLKSVKAVPVVDMAAYAAKLRALNPGLCIMGGADPSPFGYFTADSAEWRYVADRCEKAAIRLGLISPGAYWGGHGKYGSVTLRGVPLATALAELAYLGGKFVLTSTNMCDVTCYYSSDGYRYWKDLDLAAHGYTYEGYKAAVAAAQEEESAAQTAEWADREAEWAAEALASQRAAIAVALAEASARNAIALAIAVREADVRESILARARR